MVVGTIGNHLITLVHKRGGHSLGIALHLKLIFTVSRLQSLTESHCLTGNNVFERATLHSGEHS